VATAASETPSDETRNAYLLIKGCSLAKVFASPAA
jgi:hypothetical protein